MLSLLAGFVGELRAAGIPVSMSEHVDAARAIQTIDLSDRDLTRDALRATLVKDAGHIPAFERAFDVFFALRGVESPAADETGPRPRARRRARAARAPARRCRRPSSSTSSTGRCATTTPPGWRAAPARR